MPFRAELANRKGTNGPLGALILVTELNGESVCREAEGNKPTERLGLEASMCGAVHPFGLGEIRRVPAENAALNAADYGASLSVRTTRGGKAPPIGGRVAENAVAGLRAWPVSIRRLSNARNAREPGASRRLAVSRWETHSWKKALVRL